MIAKQDLKYIALGEIKSHLDREISDQAIEEIYRFGNVMLSEVSQRLSQVNQKLYSVLGWSSASIAFLLFDKSLTTGPVWVRVIAFIALFLACVSAALCSKGIKSGVGKIPAETDWFCSRFYLDSMGMKRYHALLMFTLHQQEHLATAAKAEFLARAECLFIPGLILLALVLLIEKVPF